jgi:membrane-associated phospholipid phosphatase
VKDQVQNLTTQTPAEQRQETRRHGRSLVRGRAIVVLGLVLLAMFGLLMAAVLFLDPLALDVPITKEVQEIKWPPATWVLEAASWPGYSPQNFIWPFVVALGVAAVFRRLVEAVFLVLACVANAACDLVKVVVHRGRPSADLVNVIGHPNTFSFPSGHVCQYVLFFGLSFYFVFTLLKRGALRTTLLVLCGVLIVLVGPSRIWMGQHWASDVLGGYTLGFGLLLLLIWAYRGWEARRVSHSEVGT